jgi:FlaA1/EpsC-like NDP-sugar epimerase
MSDQRSPDPLRKLLTKIETGFNFVRRFFNFKHYMFVSVFLLAGFGFWFSYEFRFDFQVPETFADQRLILLPYVAALKLLLFYFLGAYASNWRYIGLSDIPSLLLYCLACTAVLFVSSSVGIPLA